VALYGSEAWTLEKTDQKRILRDLVLEEGVENQMNSKREKRRGIQKNRRIKDSVEHHKPTENQVGWPRNKTQQLRGKYNRGKV
jgi:hypothetical protein